MQDFDPPLELVVIDIDAGGLSEVDRARYDLEVPVLEFRFNQQMKKIVLPRVSPRLKGQGLSRWIQDAITSAAVRNRSDFYKSDYL